VTSDASSALVDAALLLLPYCVTGVAAVWLVYLVLRRRASRESRARCRQRSDERESDARELQDTLLQDTQGLILRFQAIAEQLRKGDQVRKSIEDALDRADEVLAYERDRVLEQRAEAGDLPRAIARAGAEMFVGAGVSFNVLVEGSSKDVMPAARVAIHAAVWEALSNAFRHADAGAVEAHIVYRDGELIVSVRDNGRGAAPGSFEESALRKQSGVTRMRASSKALGARLSIWSRAGAGIEVLLRIPSAAAFGKR